MDPYECSIRLKALDSGWEVLGAEAVRYRGVWPENVSYTHNEWGDDTCSFDLRRRPGAIHPDLSAFTDCEIHIAGRLAWSGRVRETPTREGDDPVISVQGQGWQYHLDDDSYQRAYVHTRLSEWKDLRSSTDVDLARDGVAAGTVSTEGAKLVLGWAKGAQLGATAPYAAVMLDLGPGNTAKKLTVDWERPTPGVAGLRLLIRAGDSDAPIATASGTATDTVDDIDLSTNSSAVTTYTLVTPRRYVAIGVYWNGGAATLAADALVALNAVTAYADSAYESGSTSALRADAIWKDALARATVLLDPDRSGITAGTFDIPEAVLDGNRSPREVIQGFNAYENYETKIDDRRPLFRPRASAPIYEIGEWSGADFEDASANSGEEILNRVIVQATGPGGIPLTEERYATGLGPLDATGIGQPANPSADVDASAWTAVAGTLTRETASPHSSPGSFKITTASNVLIEALSDAVTQPFGAGQFYQLALWAKARRTKGAAPILGGGYVIVEVDGVEVARAAIIAVSGANPFARIDIPWAQQAAGSSYRIRLSMPPITGNAGSGVNNPIIEWDTIKLYRSRPTLVDRRGFRKSRSLPLRNRSVPGAMQRIGDLYLADHRTTPFAGGFRATGLGGVRRVLGGAAVHPGWLGRDTGQLVRANHVIDPDTGGAGRDERIKTVNYDHNTLTATVSLAEDRGGFDALLERLAVIVG